MKFSEPHFFIMTKIIAHRGFWKKDRVSQNSLQSLVSANALGVYGSEFDVRMTKDERLVIAHDPRINHLKLADSEYRNIEKLPLKNGERISSLEEYLTKGKSFPQLKMFLEIKSLISKKREEKTVMRVLEVIQKLDVENQIEFISFSLNICLLLRNLIPQDTIHYLMGNLSPQEVRSLGINGIDYHYSRFLDNPTWIREAKDLGMTTGSWTVNNPEVFKILTSQGIDYITTDFPDVFLQLIPNKTIL